MIKLMGCLLLIISFSLMGCMKANTYKQRSRELENILEIIRLIDMYITYRQEPLYKAFVKAANARECWFSNVLNECTECMNKQQELDSSWQNSIRDHIKTTPLTDEDISIIEDMILGLGKSDSMGQRRVLDPVMSRITTQYKAAMSREKSLGKLYRTLGAATGVVIAIIII